MWPSGFIPFQAMSVSQLHSPPHLPPHRSWAAKIWSPKSLWECPLWPHSHSKLGIIKRIYPMGPSADHHVVKTKTTDWRCGSMTCLSPQSVHRKEWEWVHVEPNLNCYHPEVQDGHARHEIQTHERGRWNVKQRVFTPSGRVQRILMK